MPLPAHGGRDKDILMDLLAHALYGATVCSRTGFAGGSKGAPRGAGRPVITDWTAWTAALFGILPDIISMGPSFVAFWQGGMEGNFFRDLPDSAIVYYHYTHSLIVALAVSGVLWLVWKPLFVCSLA